jgi:hypothetical protein
MNERRKRPRRQSSSAQKLEMERRRARVGELVASGKDLRSCERLLREEGFAHADHVTVSRDAAHARQELAAQTLKTTEEYRQRQLGKLECLEEFVQTQADLSDAETVDRSLAVHDRVARLLGLDLARPSASVTVNVGGDAGSLEGYARFKTATRFIHSPEKWQRIWTFIAELGQDEITLTMPPAEPKQLPEPAREALDTPFTRERKADDADGQDGGPACV